LLNSAEKNFKTFPQKCFLNLKSAIITPTFAELIAALNPCSVWYVSMNMVYVLPGITWDHGEAEHI